MAAKDSAVHGVHLFEVAHVRQKNPAAEDVLKVGAASVQYRREVHQALFRLAGDICT
jgi:hypothetical protein